MDILEIRNKAITSFEKLGIPTKRHEEWKYTYINAALSNDYCLTPAISKGRESQLSKSPVLTANDIYPLLIPGLDAYIAVVENGMFITRLSSCEIKNGIRISSLFEAINHAGRDLQSRPKNKIAEKHFSRYADTNSDAFIALNTAYAQDGAFIFIPDGVTVDKPIHVVNIIRTPENLFVQPRNLFVIGKNSRVQIIESFSVQCNALVKIFTNAVTEIICGENSNTDHYIIQNESGDAIRVSATQVYQEKNSIFSNNTITLNGALVRNNLNIVPDAEGCDSYLYGLYLLKGKQHVDNHTLIDHKKPNCCSNELYIGIMDDKSTGVFNGKVHVRKDAQKTNAYQSNKNILLTDDATINTKPQLEIYADDVKCSHGATTGQLDRESLFYLRSRGIGEEKARAMLLAAFTREIIDKIKIEPLKHKLDKLIYDEAEIT